jgi:hypothetical protein
LVEAGARLVTSARLPRHAAGDGHRFT